MARRGRGAGPGDGPGGRQRGPAGGGDPRRPTSGGRHGPAASRHAQARRAGRPRPSGLTVGIVVGVLVIVAAVVLINLSLPAPVHRTYLASLASAATGSTAVDGATCGGTAPLVYHWHSHVAIYVDGQLRSIPAGVGIAPPRVLIAGAEEGRCVYPTHTHTPDGIIHIESPTRRLFTLGNFFDVWHQPLSPTRVGPVRGRLTVFVDGRPYTGNPRAITFREHELIQIDVGTPVVPPQGFTFPAGL